MKSGKETTKTAAKPAKLYGFRNVFNTFDMIADTTKRTAKSKLLHSLHGSDAHDAARCMFWLAMGTPKFYVTSKAVDLKKLPKTKELYANTDKAVRAFLEICGKLMRHELSGNAAKAELARFFAACVDSEKCKSVHASTSKYLLAVLDKKLRLGVDTTVTELWSDVVEVFGIPKGIALNKQKTGAVDKRALKMITYPCDLEPKKDGFNITFRCDFGKKRAVALSSDNMELPALQAYADAVFKALSAAKTPKKYLGESIINVDGECESHYDMASPTDAKWTSSWGKTSALVKAGLTKKGFDEKRIKPHLKKMIDNDLVFSLYDIYPQSAHTELFKAPRSTRRGYFTAVAKGTRGLVRKNSIMPIEYAVCKNEKERIAKHNEYVELGEEGSIVRMEDVGVLANSTWRGNFVKHKEYTKEDGIILGVEEGKGKYKGLAGAFVCFMVDKKKISRVTVPTDAAKKWAWKHRHEVHGFGVEVTGAKDKTGEANASRNPVLARFRVDQQPMPLKKVQELCKKHKLPVPTKDNMSTKLFTDAVDRIAK